MLVVAYVLSATLAATPVPDGGYILINGSPGAEEWVDAGTMLLDPDTEIRFHKDDKSFFLAIVFLGPRHTGVDLYIQSRGNTRMLHVSSALGEKTLEDGQWSNFAWGQNSWWSANVIESIYEEGRQRFLEPAAFEFQIDRIELGADIDLFIHLKRPEKLLPPGGSVAAIEGWLRLGLE